MQNGIQQHIWPLVKLISKQEFWQEGWPSTGCIRSWGLKALIRQEVGVTLPFLHKCALSEHNCNVLSFLGVCRSS